MINLNLNTSFYNYNAIQKQGVTKPSLKLNTPLTKDTVSFTGRMSQGLVYDMTYKNVLDEQLVSKPRPTFEEDLKKVKGITSYDAAKTRISSLSRYLKEDMVGFVVPEYKSENVLHGGYQWFQQGAEYLLRGATEGEVKKIQETVIKDGEEKIIEKTTKTGTAEADFKSAAKELYGLLATHDNYWKSPEFVDYLSTLDQTPAIKATISAVKELNKSKDVPFTGQKVIRMYGYFSPMKAMDKLLNDGCAYTGNPLQFDDPTTKHDRISPEKNASLEHIMPKNWNGPCEDYNYMLTAVQANSKRGDMGLIQYLKGASA